MINKLPCQIKVMINKSTSCYAVVDFVMTRMILALIALLFVLLLLLIMIIPSCSSLIILSLYFCPVEGNGEQNNRLSLKLPDSAIPESQYALLTVIGGSKTTNFFRLMLTAITFFYLNLNFVNCTYVMI